MKGVHSTNAALKQDALNAKMKRSPLTKGAPLADKFLTLADDLWRIADERRNLGDVHQWIPDSKTRTLREQLVRMAEALAEGVFEDAATRPTTPQKANPQEILETPAKVPASDRQAEPNMEAARLREELADKKAKVANLEASTQSINISENVRLRRAIEEQQAKILKMEKSLITHIAAREKRKSRDAWLREYSVAGKLMLNDTMMTLQVCALWSNEVGATRTGKHLETAKVARRALAAGLRERIFDLADKQLDRHRRTICFYNWLVSVDEAKGLCGVNKEVNDMRSRIVLDLGNWFDWADKADVIECMEVWKAVMREANTRKGAAKGVADAQEEGLATKNRLMGKFADKAMSQSLRTAKDRDVQLVQDVFDFWLRHFDEYRKAKAVEDEHKRQKAEAAAMRAKAVQLAMGGPDKMLIQEVWQIWKEMFIVTKALMKTQGRKEQAMKSALREIAHNEEAFRQSVFSAWSAEVHEERARQKLGSLQAQMTLVANARKKAIGMIDSRLEKVIQQLAAECFSNWAHAKEIIEAKEKAMNQAMRGIAKSTEAMVKMSFQGWARSAGNDKELNKERARRRRLADLARLIVIKLRDRLQLRMVFDGWYIRAII